MQKPDNLWLLVGPRWFIKRTVSFWSRLAAAVQSCFTNERPVKRTSQATYVNGLATCLTRPLQTKRLNISQWEKKARSRDGRRRLEAKERLFLAPSRQLTQSSWESVVWKGRGARVVDKRSARGVPSSLCCHRCLFISETWEQGTGETTRQQKKKK